MAQNAEITFCVKRLAAFEANFRLAKTLEYTGKLTQNVPFQVFV